MFVCVPGQKNYYHFQNIFSSLPVETYSQPHPRHRKADVSVPLLAASLGTFQRQRDYARLEVQMPNIITYPVGWGQSFLSR